MGSRKGRKRSSTSRSAGRSRSWLLFWPLLLALVASPFAVRTASVLALTGPAALRLLYPFVSLIEAPSAHLWLHGLAPEQRDTLAQWMLWAQFPAYGLLASLLARWRGIGTGLVVVLLLHALAVAAALATAHAAF